MHNSPLTGIVPPRWRRLALLGLACLALSACKDKQETPRQPAAKAEPVAITLCHGGITDILPRIALEHGFFTGEGLAVTIKEMDGKQAFTGLLAGECDFAVNAAPPIVSLTVPGQSKFAILATVMADDDSVRIVARRDRGINSPQDFKGKRIGTKKGVLGHFFLDLFVMKNGLASGDVTPVFMESEQLQPALAAGEIDGFSMTNKLVLNAARALGDQAKVFAEPGLSISYGILTTRTDVPLDLQVTPQLLQALLKAEEFAKREPTPAKAMVATAAKLSEKDVDDIWTRTDIEVRLDNSLFVNLEDTYKWMVERGSLPAAQTFPNFLTFVEPRHLSAIRPGAVSVIKR